MGLPKPIAIESLLDKQREPQAKNALAQRVAAIHDEFLARMVSLLPVGARGRTDALHPRGARRNQGRGPQTGPRYRLCRPILDAILERLGSGRSGLFDVTVASDEVPRGRPFPDLIFKAMSLSGVTDLSSRGEGRGYAGPISRRHRRRLRAGHRRDQRHPYARAIGAASVRI